MITYFLNLEHLPHGTTDYITHNTKRHTSQHNAFSAQTCIRRARPTACGLAPRNPRFRDPMKIFYCAMHISCFAVHVHTFLSYSLGKTLSSASSAIGLLDLLSKMIPKSLHLFLSS